MRTDINYIFHYILSSQHLTYNNSVPPVNIIILFFFVNSLFDFVNISQKFKRAVITPNDTLHYYGKYYLIMCSQRVL